MASRSSRCKAFTSVLVLQLEAEHKLSINDTLGKWLPQYPAWAGVTIKRLLNMTSGIPNYTDSGEFWSDVAAAPNRVFSASRLVSYVLGLPPTHGYSYSNTNYILAQMIIDRAAHDNYGSQLRKRITIPLSLRNMFYSATNYRRAITSRTPAGYWFIPLLPAMKSQLRHDQSDHTLSWAQGAGGIVSSRHQPGDVQEIGDRVALRGGNEWFPGGEHLRATVRHGDRDRREQCHAQRPHSRACHIRLPDTAQGGAQLTLCLRLSGGEVFQFGVQPIDVLVERGRNHFCGNFGG